MYYFDIFETLRRAIHEGCPVKTPQRSSVVSVRTFLASHFVFYHSLFCPAISRFQGHSYRDLVHPKLLEPRMTHCTFDSAQSDSLAV